MKTLDRRLMKLETAGANLEPVFIVLGSDDNEDELLSERFGEDGPPAGLTVIFVNTGVPRPTQLTRNRNEEFIQAGQ